MAVPRPILLAVLGLLLVSATFMATRNAHTATESSKPAAHATVARPAPTPKPAAKPDPPAAAKADPPAPAAAKADPPAAKPAEKHATSSVSGKHQARPVHHAAVSKPAAVKQAINSGHVVVLAFFQRRGADDRATRQAVADLRHRHLARVFMDRIDHIGRYGTVVGSLGIHQAPAVVIVDAKRHARLVEGYVDSESLAQEVSDARK